MTTTEIAAEHGVSRQSIHAYRRTGAFPQPVEGEGSTRPRFREDEVAAFFAANPKQPGKKRSSPPKQQGAPVTITTAHARLMETLKSPGLVGLSDEEAAEQVDAHRQAVLREAADLAEQTFITGVTPATSERDKIWDQAVRAVAAMLRSQADEETDA